MLLIESLIFFKVFIIGMGGCFTKQSNDSNVNKEVPSTLVQINYNEENQRKIIKEKKKITLRPTGSGLTEFIFDI